MTWKILSTMQNNFLIKEDFLRSTFENYDDIEYTTKIVDGRVCKVLSVDNHTLHQLLLAYLLDNNVQKFDQDSIKSVINTLKNEEFLIDYKTNKVLIPDRLLSLYQSTFVSKYQVSHYNYLLYALIGFSTYHLMAALNGKREKKQ